MNILEFAINMEIEGEKYYKDQAEINKDNALSTVFLYLAKDEENHAKILQNKVNGLSDELTDNETLTKAKSVFQEISNYSNKIMEIPRQLELYRAALEKEKESIELYRKLLSETASDEEKILYEYLVKQEASHIAILESIILLVSRPNEWVESAEFGLREQY